MKCYKFLKFFIFKFMDGNYEEYCDGGFNWLMFVKGLLV